MYAKYSDGSAVTLVQARYTRTDPQDLTAYHIPLTDINGAIPLGLNWQTWTINGVIADPMSVRWRDIVLLSLDNISWRTCRYQVVGFPKNLLGQSLYELTMLVSPLLEGPIVRYPTTGYKWGNQSITGISQAGNVNAYPIIHYLAPLFYAPLSNTLLDITGQSVTFTRAAPKTHNGIVYPINTPIFDSGLYLASDTAQDVATWTPAVSALKTIAMQIKMTRPIAGTNLISNGDFETDVTGWGAASATLSRETGTPLVGTGSLKMLVTNPKHYTTQPVTAIVGHIYYFGGLFKSTAGAGRKVRIGCGDTLALVDCSASAHTMSVTFVATSTTNNLFFQLDGDVGNEYILADSLVCYDLGLVQNVWSGAFNFLTINLVTSLLTWNDGMSTVVSVAFPTASYLAGTVIDIVAIEDTSHAVTIAVHPAGGSWVSASVGLWALAWPQLALGNLEGSIVNLIEYPYVLTSTEYQALDYSSLALKYNTLFIGNRYAGEVIKGSDKRLLNVNGSDISALLGGTDIPIGASAVTIAQSQGLSARWYVEVKRTDV